MAETDVNIAEECELTEQEYELFLATLAGIYNKETDGWLITVKNLAQSSKVRNALHVYFKKNPLTLAEDIELH